MLDRTPRYRPRHELGRRHHRGDRPRARNAAGVLLACNGSPQIKREVERAVSKEQIIVPVRVDEVKPTGDFEYFLGTPHWLDAITPPFERHPEKIADSAKFWLERREGDTGDASAQSVHESKPQGPVNVLPPAPRPTSPNVESMQAGAPRPAPSSNRLDGSS
jgi:hypothetical protein